jgi:hypothetical protein
MADLRQILAQGRKRIGLLVGAGAPFSIKVDKDGQLKTGGVALIPNVADLTRKTLSALDKAQVPAVEAIQKSLGAEANIEAILSQIRLMERAIGDTPVHGLDSKGYNSLGKVICEQIGALVGAKLPSERCAYGELVAWVSGTQRSHAVEIFTTNYDLLFEEAFERVRAPYFDGFSGGSAPFFDPVTVAGNDLPARWSRLWKLHGSLGWHIEDGNIVRGRGRGASQLVYPDHLKYDLTQKQPYSALFERLRNFLLTPDTLLLATGFSFNDAHVCAVIDETLGMNANSSILAFQHQSLDKEKAVCQLAYNHPNLSVYAADGAVISGVAGKWRLGDLPKNWLEIRQSFWGAREVGKDDVFLLGDFVHFARFCSMAQAVDFTGEPVTPGLSGPIAVPITTPAAV